MPSLLACQGETSSIVFTTCKTFLTASFIDLTQRTLEWLTCSDFGAAFFSGASYTVTATPIFVKYQPSDLSLLQKAAPTWGLFPGATTTAPTTQASSGSSSGLPSQTSPSSSGSPSETSSSGGSSGLSQDAKIAIGVAAPVAVIAFLLGVFLAMRWRKQSKSTPAPGGLEHLKPELDGQGTLVSAPERQELEATAPRAELAAETVP